MRLKVYACNTDIGVDLSAHFSWLVEIHAAPHTYVKAYAASVGRARTTVQNEVKAARVVDL